jgi:hypothetical protein
LPPVKKKHNEDNQAGRIISQDKPLAITGPGMKNLTQPAFFETND